MSARGVLRVVSGGRLGFFCEGCRKLHVVPVDPSAPTHWGWNGSYDRPTFAPSILVRGVHDLTDEEYACLAEGEEVEPRPYTCHSFVRDGEVQFLPDCTHELAGTTRPLRPLGVEP